MNEENLEGLVGTPIIAIYYKTVCRAIDEVIEALGPDATARLKIDSGEHLAAIMATAFLGVAPCHTDVDGGPDLVFDLSSRPGRRFVVGRDHAQFADFEVKSLPGPTRQYNAETNRAQRRGQQPRQTEFRTVFRAAADVVAAAGPMIGKAAAQLEAKSSPERARVVFLVSHPFDHLYVEIMQTFVAQHLPPLTDLPDTVDAVWLLLFPGHLIVWSVPEQQWATLHFTGTNAGEELPGADEGFEFLAAVDMEFGSRLGTTQPSPYAYKLEN
jgi:hypothetical protein